MNLTAFPQDEEHGQAEPNAADTRDVHAGDADTDHAEGGEVDWMDHYLNPTHLIEHVQDTYYFELPSLTLSQDSTFKIWIPNVLGRDEAHPVIGVPENNYISPLTLRPSKFMVLELVGAILVAAMFIGLARRIKNGDRARGRFWNMLEAMVVFVRNDIARPAIGKKDATRFLPFIWTIFFFILTLNLLGMVPFLGAATGALGCTIALALITFVIVLGTGFKQLGVVGFWKAQAPHIEIAEPMRSILVFGIWCIEVFGLFIKHMVLAVRLFANMFAGHLVLAVFVAFIGVTWTTFMVWGVAPMSIGASVMLSLLELLVALIQAYVFAFLAALFIGAALHPH